MSELTLPPISALGPDNIEEPVSESVPQYVHTDPQEFARDLLNRNQVTDEMVEAALANADVMKPTARVEVRMPTEAFLTMISTDGEYKTVHDGATTQGGSKSLDKNNYLDRRTETEERFGFASHNVVYGYLGNTAETDIRTQALFYGKIALILKPEVADRTSFTVGDSMLDLFRDRSPMNFDTAVVAKELNDIAKYTGDEKAEPYIEAQVVGGVTLDDVERVSYTSDSTKPDEIRSFIETFQSHCPDIQLTVRIPSTRQISYANFELADEFPNVPFVFNVVIEDGWKIVDFPSITAHRMEHHADNPDFQKRHMSESQNAYTKAKQRVEDLDAAVHRMWQEKHGNTEFPTNVSIVLERKHGQ